MQTERIGTCSTRVTSPTTRRAYSSPIVQFSLRMAISRRVRLDLALSRSIGGGVHEDLDLVNHGMKPVRFNLEIAIRSDFADLFEVKSKHIVRRGRIATEWSDDKSELRTIYRNQDFCREVTIRTRRNNSRPVYANGRISFEVDLQPGAAWHSCLLYELGDGKVRFEAPDIA